MPSLPTTKTNAELAEEFNKAPSTVYNIKVKYRDQARAVLRSLQAGNGRLIRCEVKDELPQRLQEDGVQYRAEDLQLALVRLEDAGCITRVQRQPYTVYPQFVVRSGLRRYNGFDALAADIAAVVKQRGEEFESQEQLRQFLDEDQVQYELHSLVVAVCHLESIGRLKRPRQDQWRDDVPLPGYWVPPRIFNE
jgi:hypothetical protein